ncbi:MAG TPA: carboxypeptidase regulatory-like domain-containing protein [Blastocatellia bacterium]|nr:carboxypeptidase regulatory-like domain-containing protein [Blastocatellia bacterium]HNG31184.1 carboxypeptidase regulatory-like domain-containing protein [Blastocatellia bacterium]
MLSQRSLFSRMFLLFVLIVPFTLFAQTPKEGTATIIGTVTLNGEPMRNVVVTIRPQNPTGPASSFPRAKTDANGRFRLTGVSGGQYILGALAPAFVSENDQPFPYLSPSFTGKTVNVSEGETVENVEIKLKRGGVITGRVTDAHGEPAAEINVRVSRITTPSASGMAGPPQSPMSMGVYRTDDRGEYRVFGLPAGKYKVSVGLATRQGYFSMQTSRSYIPETFHPDTTDEAKAKIIELEEGLEVTDVDIKAAEEQKAYEVSGRVVNAETGQPITGVNLSFASFDANGRMTGAMNGGWRSDANGEFRILGARPGKHGILIEDREGKGEFYSPPAQFEVVSSDVEGIEVRALRGATISGTVVIEGTNDPAILARRSQIRLNSADRANTPGTTRYGQANPDGTFRITGLPEGQTRIWAFADLQKLSLLRVEQNGVALNDSMLEVHPGEQISNLRAVFAFSDGTISGQARVSGGTLPEGIKLSVMLRRYETVSNARRLVPAGPMITPDARGQFVVRDLVPGEYEVTPFPVSQNGQLSSEFRAKMLPRFMRAKQTVAVSNGNETRVTLSLDLSQEN